MNDGTRHPDLLELLESAREQALGTGAPVLLSMSERVPAIDPLELLAAFSGERAVEAAGKAAGERSEGGPVMDRMYWARPDEGFAIASIGSAMAFAPRGDDRFANVARAWSELLESAIILDASSGLPGVGPTLLGGFSFDPRGPRTDLWRAFPAALLNLPRLQMAVVDDSCWLTMNVVVSSDGSCAFDPEALLLLRSRALAVRAEWGASANLERLGWSDVHPSAEWKATVAAAISRIHAGELEKVVLAREARASASREFDVVATLRHLSAAHPSCSVFGCWVGDSAFVGASPERLLRTEGDEVRTSSLAGSAARGATAERDAIQAAGLLASAKDREEHEVVRRALCEGLESLCDDVRSEPAPSLLTLPDVHHLHTSVQARMRPGVSPLAVVAELHPSPAVGGAPREAALHFIQEHERMDRGWYAAPVGWIQRDRSEFAVALRSAVVRGSEASLFAGCGIVADSDPVAEFEESLLKLRPMAHALARSLIPDQDVDLEPVDSLLDADPAEDGAMR